LQPRVVDRRSSGWLIAFPSEVSAGGYNDVSHVPRIGTGEPRPAKIRYSGGPPNLTVTWLEQFWVTASHTL
jgi:hypothetical protein